MNKNFINTQTLNIFIQTIKTVLFLYNLQKLILNKKKMILAYFFGLHFKLRISYHRHDERKKPNKNTHKKLKNN